MAYQQINIAKSNNGIPLWMTDFSDGDEYILTQNVGISVLIPSGVNLARFSYSAGATVKVSYGDVGYPNVLATDDTGLRTNGEFNLQGARVSQYNAAGAQQYLHLISPNPSDRVKVTFNNGAT